MSLSTWIEQGIISVPENRDHVPLFTTQFTFNPFPYLPPELIVSILAYAPASSIPHLYTTNHFFRTHIDIYKKQLFKIRLTKYPTQFLTAYTSIHGTDFDTLHTLSNAWDALSVFEIRADVCLSVERVLPGIGGYRFYRAFLRQWESRQGMFFNKDDWAEALVERCHVYEDCSRSEICDIIHLQMVYRNILSFLPWHAILEPCHSTYQVGGRRENDAMVCTCMNDGMCTCGIHGVYVSDMRIHWSYKTELYRNIIDQTIGCGPEFILLLLSSPTETVIAVLRQCMQVLKDKGGRYCCFDDVMAKLLRRWDRGEGIVTRWQEEESYFEVCASGRYFTEGEWKGFDVKYTSVFDQADDSFRYTTFGQEICISMMNLYIAKTWDSVNTMDYSRCCQSGGVDVSTLKLKGRPG